MVTDAGLLPVWLLDVEALRAAWPDVIILVRGDSGLAVPEIYEFCGAEWLLYTIG